MRPPMWALGPINYVMTRATVPPNATLPLAECDRCSVRRQPILPLRKVDVGLEGGFALDAIDHSA